MSYKFLSNLRSLPIKLANCFPPIEYANPAYWNYRYQKESTRYEWYANYKDLRKIITTHIPYRLSSILNIGNGTSSIFYFKENMGNK